MKKTLRVGWIALLFLTCGRFAQAAPNGADHSDVRMVSSFVPIGEPVPEDCGKQAHVLAGSLAPYARPISWHWVLVCDEAGWRRFLRLSGRGEEDSIYASTDLATRTTYLRGAKLLHPQALGDQLNHVLVHELAHIWLNSEDESEAEALARRWIRNPDETKRVASKAEETGNDMIRGVHWP